MLASICLGGALIGCLLSGWIADGVGPMGHRRAFQLCALPMIIGAIMRLYLQNQCILFDSLCLFVKLSELLRGHHSKGIYFSWFISRIVLSVYVIVVILSLVSCL